MTGRPQTIQERIACWQTAYHAVLDELVQAHQYRQVGDPTKLPKRSTLNEAQYVQVQGDAARVAATLAIGATIRSRNTGGE